MAGTITLDVAPSARPVRLAGAVFAGALAVLGLIACMFVMAQSLASGATPTAVSAFFGVSGLVFVLLLALTVRLGFAVVRYAARLEGTTLVVRGPFGVRRVDLATATVRTERPAIALSLNPPARSGPRLHAVGADGTTVSLPLRTARRQWLPPAQLTALADAVGPRPEARQVADALRAVAADPRGPLL